MADRAQVSKLQWAVRSEDLSSLSKLLSSDNSLVNAVDYDKRTPLHVAALFDCRKAAQILLSQVDINHTAPSLSLSLSLSLSFICLLFEGFGFFSGACGGKLIQ
jgi:ankyrin repeat protein